MNNSGNAMPILLADRLSKQYGNSRALDELTLSIEPGEVVGLLGPNGSGKTTALRLFLGFIKPTSGSAKLGGHDCWHDSVETRKLVTYLPGELRLYENMTGRQLVTFLGRLRGETPGSEVDLLAQRLDIDPDQPLTTMSSGMKRKVALLAVLVPRVPFIILDEPTNTLDPNMRDELLLQLSLAKEAGKAVLFSSHVLQEVETICDRVAILRKGKLVHLQTMSELKQGRRVTAMLTDNALSVGPDDKPLSVTNGKLDLEYRGAMPNLLRWLASIACEDVRIQPIGLQAIYQRFHGDAQ